MIEIYESVTKKYCPIKGGPCNKDCALLYGQSCSIRTIAVALCGIESHVMSLAWEKKGREEDEE